MFFLPALPYAQSIFNAGGIPGVLCGLVLIVLGIASGAMSKTTGGTDVQDFFSGILMGLSVVEILAGLCVAGKALLKQ